MQANERLVNMNIGDYSARMKDDGRKKFFNILQKTADPDRMKKGIKFSEFARTQKDGN